MAGSTKTLFVFDFDHTLVDDNTDTWIMSLCPELQLIKKLPSIHRDHHGWTKLMDHVFSLLHQQGCTKEAIEQHMRKLTLYKEAMNAVSIVHECSQADSIIISDSNSVFIDLILEECGIKFMFAAVYTNPAHFEATGRLRVTEYGSHSCRVCSSSPNLCKSMVLKDYLRCHGDYRKVVYVGDGRGDYCPALSLSKDDVIICREGYKLAHLLSSSEPSCQANVAVIDFVQTLSESIIQNI